MTKRLPILAALILSACGGVGTDAPALTPGGRAIINGNVETGWPAVGAVAIKDGWYFYGSLCTGTLIDPEWVLTAKHCVTHYGFGPNNLRFVTGPDAQFDAGYDPPCAPGCLRTISEIRTHDTGDVGLLRLSPPVLDIAPQPIRTGDIASLYDAETSQGQDVFYVGYGMDDGVNQTGEGLKRSGSMRVKDPVGPTGYWSDNGWLNPPYTATCFGDSGGPGFHDFGEGLGWEVVGVVSGLLRRGLDDACLGDSYHERVDYYAPWIADAMASAPPDCRVDGSLCHCAEACSPIDGSCDNPVCETLDCREITACEDACPTQGCYDLCYLRGTAAGRALYDAYMHCYWDCQATADPAACTAAACADEWDTCQAREGTPEEAAPSGCGCGTGAGPGGILLGLVAAVALPRRRRETR